MAIKKRDIQPLIQVIASRVLTAAQISERFGYPVEELRAFVDEYTHAIEEKRWQLEDEANEQAPDLDLVPQEQLEGFWITNKTKRIEKYQAVVDALLQAISAGGFDAVTLREARSYMMYVATELGQIPLRGQGKNTDEDENAAFELVGVDMGRLT